MAFEFKLPDIGEGIAEGEIVKWLVDVGDSVEEDQPIVEVMTDKATVEIPSPRAGKVSELCAKEGETVPIGTVIFKLDGERGSGANGAPSAASSAREGGEGSEKGAGARGSREPEKKSSASARAPAPQRSAPVKSGGTATKTLAVPSARKLARELGIDIGDVPGSGRNGLIRKSDVEEYAGRAGAAPAAAREEKPALAPARRFEPIALAPEEGEERIPFRGVRKKIAEVMTRSVSTAVHFTVVEEVDVTELFKVYRTAKDLGVERGVKVTLTPFFMKAAALALQEYPQFNSMLDEARQEIVRYNHVHLGIGTDTENGLIVPVVRDVDWKGILQLSYELHQLIEKTRAGKATPDELRGSTFTITNAGNIGGILATPIINFPEVAIMGVHRVMRRPAVLEGDRVEVRDLMNFSLSVDHRLVDGADACRFLVYVKTLLEQPALLAL